jgi:hypothetical protein
VPELPRIHFNPILSPFSNIAFDHPRRPAPAPPAVASDGSVGSAGSLWSIGSAGSILSIGSSGSILSIGSAGSILSIGSAASVGSLLSFGSVGSVASALSVGAVGGWLERPGQVVQAGATVLAVAALASAALRP